MTSRNPQTPSAANTPLPVAYPDQAGAIGGLSDMALAVVVGTLTLVGVVGFFQTSSSGAKTNAEVANFTSLVSNIRSAYWQAGSNFAGISAGDLASSRIAPQPLIADDSTLTSMFGGGVTVGVDTTTNDQFQVTYAALPRDACVKMVTTTSHTISNIVSIQVGTGAVRAVAAGAPISMANASGDCASNTQNVTWTLAR